MISTKRADAVEDRDLTLLEKTSDAANQLIDDTLFALERDGPIDPGGLRRGARN